MNFPGDVQTANWLRQFKQKFLTTSCGEWTYGRPQLKLADTDQARTLKIGRYCSIGEEVSIFVGRQGRHRTDTLTTYPLPLAIFQTKPDAKMQLNDESIEHLQKNLDVNIGHDVWIGSRVTILAGVSVGTGAVIGNGAVVTKDIPPYAIAVGVPAKVTRYRHSETIISRLLNSRWWDLEPEKLYQIGGKSIVSSDVDAFLDRLEEHLGGSQIAMEAPPLAGLAPERIYHLFTSEEGMQLGLPQWPSEETQRRFTGGSGLHLLNRARIFVETLDKDGAFAKPRWRGLDYGCGWGRLASFMLTRGSAQQLDMCDAWEGSIDLSKRGNFKNRIFKVSDIVAEGELPDQEYDFCYAMSVFTHLNREAFENNLTMLAKSLKKGGRLYFTVRFESFIDHLKRENKLRGDARLNDDGFWSIIYEGKECYGETAVNMKYLKNLAENIGKLSYIGCPDFEQNLFKITL